MPCPCCTCCGTCGRIPQPAAGRALRQLLRPPGPAMFHGHLNIAQGEMGIEAFLHDGVLHLLRIFPSLIRMPYCVDQLFRRRSDCGSLLVAWIMTGLFSSLMLWRLRVLMRGRPWWSDRGRGYGCSWPRSWRIGDHLPHRHTVHLQRGLCLEHPAHRGRPVRHDRGHGAPSWAGSGPASLWCSAPTWTAPRPATPAPSSRPDRRLLFLAGAGRPTVDGPGPCWR